MEKCADGSAFDAILEMVEEVTKMGVEVCCTLGTLHDGQAQKLKEAGLFAYNHNLDTSREFYPQIVTTRTYDERLATLKKAREAGITNAAGGSSGWESRSKIGSLSCIRSARKLATPTRSRSTCSIRSRGRPSLGKSRSPSGRCSARWPARGS